MEQWNQYSRDKRRLRRRIKKDWREGAYWSGWNDWCHRNLRFARSRPAIGLSVCADIIPPGANTQEWEDMGREDARRLHREDGPGYFEALEKRLKSAK